MRRQNTNFAWHGMMLQAVVTLLHTDITLLPVHTCTWECYVTYLYRLSEDFSHMHIWFCAEINFDGEATLPSGRTVLDCSYLFCSTNWAPFTSLMKLGVVIFPFFVHRLLEYKRFCFITAHFTSIHTSTSVFL